MLLVIIVCLQGPSRRLLFDLAAFMFGFGHFQVEALHDTSHHLIVYAFDVSGSIDCGFFLFVVSQSPANYGVMGKCF